MEIAERQKIGGVAMCSTDFIRTCFACSRRTAHYILSSLRIPVIYTKEGPFFNLDSLERTLYYLTRVGGKGFILPGSERKRRGHTEEETEPTQITDHDLAEMACPAFEMEYGKYVKSRGSFSIAGMRL